jgi:hypothetical protein
MRSLRVFAALVSIAVVCGAARAQEKKSAVTDPAKADADFLVQGEYTGKIDGEKGKDEVGVQIIALGSGKFRAVGCRGGLPGAGWDKSDKIKSESQAKEGALVFADLFGTATHKDGALVIASAEGKELGKLARVERASPTLGGRPPRGAKVLFGDEANEFDPGNKTDDGHLAVGQKCKHTFAADYTLHVEFRTPYQPYAGGQGRGNSGVYLMGKDEIQVLDSFGLEGVKNECGALYGKKAPDVNMCLPPLSWQTFDVEYTIARPAADGQPAQPARLTVRHNGVVIHDNVELGNTSKGGLTLQNHGNPVAYRNIWVVEKGPPQEKEAN